MQVWNFYSTDGSQANKKLHSNPQPRGRFNRNAALFFSDRPSSYLEHQNFVVTQFQTQTERLIPFKEKMPTESVYTSTKVNMALNYFYHTTSLFFNSTILTDFSGPTVELKYENFAEGSYKFGLTLKNENNQTPTKAVNSIQKSVTVKVIKNLPVSFKMHPKSKIPEALPEKEVDISNYFEQKGYVSLFSPRDAIDLQLVKINPVLRKAAEKAGSGTSLIKLQEELQGDTFTEEKIVSISGNLILTLKNQFKKTPITKTPEVKLLTLEKVVKSQTLELMDLNGLKVLRSIPIIA